MYSIFTSDLNKKNLNRIIKKCIEDTLKNPEIVYTMVKEAIEDDLFMNNHEMIFESREAIKKLDFDID